MSTYILIFGLILVITQLASCQSNRKQCLSCERVAKPEDCLQRIRCAPEEECFTERYVTIEGHVFYDLGCKLRSTCAVTSYDVSKAELDRRVAALNTSPLGKRQNNGEPMAAHVCMECCDYDHCNDLLCGGHSSKGLKCVHCTDMEDMANCEKVRGCPGHEMCFVEERITDKFQLLYSSGCMREVQCQAFAREKGNAGGLFDPCFKCCNETFCNAHCEDVTTPAPVVTTASPVTPAVTGTPAVPVGVSAVTGAPVTSGPVGSGSTNGGVPPLPVVTSGPSTGAPTPNPGAGTPPPIAGGRRGLGY